MSIVTRLHHESLELVGQIANSNDGEHKWCCSFSWFLSGNAGGALGSLCSSAIGGDTSCSSGNTFGSKGENMSSALRVHVLMDVGVALVGE